MKPRIRWGGMRVKIIAWSFVPTALILIAVAWVAFNAYQQVTEELVIERNQELTRLSTGEFTARLSEYTGLLTEYTALAHVYGNDPEAQQNALERARSRFEIFDGGVIVINGQGVVTASEPKRPEALGQDWSDRDYFRQMLRSPAPVFSNIVADGLGRREVIVVAVPIRGDQDQFMGIVAGMFRLSSASINQLYSDIAMLRVGKSRSTYLVDGNGRVIYHSDAGNIGEDFSGQKVVAQVSRGEVGALRTQGEEGQEIVASYAPVPNTSWSLVSEESWTALITPSQSYRNFLLLLLLMGVIIPAFVVAVGVRRITRPITELISAAQEVAGGKFGQTITAHTNDEVGELAEQFSLMAAQLQESYRRLEQRVNERTKELATLNAIAASVSRSQDLEDILQDALDKTLRVIDIETGGIYLVDNTSGMLILRAQRGFSPQLVDNIDRLKMGEGFSGLVAKTGEALVVRDVSIDPRLTRMAVRDEGFHSLVSVPLRAKGRVLGTLFAATREECEFTEHDVQLLSSIGRQIGVAIENARLLERERWMRQEATLLAEMAKLISGTLDLDEVLRLTAEYAVDVFDVDCCNILLCNEGRETLSSAAHVGFDHPAAMVSGVQFVLSEATRQKVFEDLQPLIVQDVPEDPHLRPQTALDLQSALVVPIEVGGRRLGVMQLGTHRPRRRRFTDEEGELALAMANQAAVAIDNARLFKAEQRRVEQFQVIGAVGRRIISILPVDELLDQMAKLIQKAFGYYHVGFGLIEGDEVVSKAGAGPLWDAYKALRLKVGAEGVGGWVAHTGEPLLVSDVSKEPRYRVVADATGTCSELCVPLKTKDAVIGVLDVQSDQLDAFDGSDVELLQSLANQTAVAVENARLFRDATRQVRELRALADASRVISSVLDQDQLLQALYEQVTRIAPTDFYVIALYDEETNVVSIEINVDEGVHYPKDQYVLDRGLLKLVIHNRQPLRFYSLTEEKHKLEVEIVPSGSPRVNHGWLGVPMLYGEKVLGAIVVGSYERGSFDAGHEQTLSSIANQAAVALENARLYEQAKQLAILEERQRLARDLHDAVTQTLFSASLISESLPALWERDQNEGRQLLKELRQLSRGALAEMRTLLLELRPAALVEASLGDLLRQLAEAITGRTGLPVTVTTEVESPQHSIPVRDVLIIPSDVHVALYRIAQEAFNNVVKHAQASQVTVKLRLIHEPPQREGVELWVGDDGRGFDPDNVPPDRLGLGIIRERAESVGARLEIESRIGRGTQIKVAWEKEA